MSGRVAVDPIHARRASFKALVCATAVALARGQRHDIDGKRRERLKKQRVDGTRLDSDNFFVPRFTVLPSATLGRRHGI